MGRTRHSPFRFLPRPLICPAISLPVLPPCPPARRPLLRRRRTNPPLRDQRARTCQIWAGQVARVTGRDRVTEGAVGGRGRPIGIVCAAIARLLAQGYPHGLLLSSPSTRPAPAPARPRVPGSPAIFSFAVVSRPQPSPCVARPRPPAVDSAHPHLRTSRWLRVFRPSRALVFRTRLCPRANVSPPICLPCAPPPACPLSTRAAIPWCRPRSLPKTRPCRPSLSFPRTSASSGSSALRTYPMLARATRPTTSLTNSYRLFNAVVDILPPPIYTRRTWRMGPRDSPRELVLVLAANPALVYRYTSRVFQG